MKRLMIAIGATLISGIATAQDHTSCDMADFRTEHNESTGVTRVHGVMRNCPNGVLSLVLYDGQDRYLGNGDAVVNRMGAFTAFIEVGAASNGVQIEWAMEYQHEEGIRYIDGGRRIDSSVGSVPGSDIRSTESFSGGDIRSNAGSIDYWNARVVEELYEPCYREMANQLSEELDRSITPEEDISTAFEQEPELERIVSENITETAKDVSEVALFLLREIPEFTEENLDEFLEENIWKVVREGCNTSSISQILSEQSDTENFDVERVNFSEERVREEIFIPCLLAQGATAIAEQQLNITPEEFLTQRLADPIFENELTDTISTSTNLLLDIAENLGKNEAEVYFQEMLLQCAQ